MVTNVVLLGVIIKFSKYQGLFISQPTVIKLRI